MSDFFCFLHSTPSGSLSLKVNSPLVKFALGLRTWKYENHIQHQTDTPFDQIWPGHIFSSLISILQLYIQCLASFTYLHSLSLDLIWGESHLTDLFLIHSTWAKGDKLIPTSGFSSFLNDRQILSLGEIEQQTQMLRESTPAICIHQYKFSYINSKTLPRREENQ